MKKINISLIIGCVSISFTCAQVPDSVSQKFRNEYPNADDAQWSIIENGYSVVYRDQQNIDRLMCYDKHGIVTRRQYQVSVVDILPNIANYYGKHYPQETHYEVWEENDKTGNKLYSINRKTEVLYFDKNGNYVRKGKSEPFVSNRKK